MVISGEYGARHLRNIQEHAPAHWQLEAWQAPQFFPLVIDYPEDFLPESMPRADLILSFAEHKGVAELLPEIVKLTGAQWLGDGSFRFAFTNNVGALFSVLATTNPALPMSNWTILGAAAEGPAGSFQFTDTQAPGDARRFYRTRAP